MRGILGDVVFGIDDETMESVVIEALRRRGLTVAVAEPLTGGLVSSRLVAAEGHAAVLRGAIVPGAADVARQMLAAGLDVDEASAAGLAARVRERFGADIGLAALGVVDESEAHEQPVGTVFMGLAIGEEARSRTVRLPGDRSRLRQFTVITLLNALRLELGRLQASVAP